MVNFLCIEKKTDYEKQKVNKMENKINSSKYYIKHTIYKYIFKCHNTTKTLSQTQNSIN